MNIEFANEDFRKSSFSPDAGSCVEVALKGNVIGVRDSKDPHSPILVFDAREWQAFLSGVKASEFDLG